MNDVTKRFSLTTVVATALISFMISGVGGALFQRYLSQAKPSIIVTSAGFEGAQDHVEIPAELIRLSQEDSWGASLARYELYATLRDRETESAEIEARLSKTIASVEAWLKEGDSGSDQVSVAELLRHPLFNDATFGSSINGYIRRTELPSPPHADVADRSVLFPVFQNDGQPEVHTGKIAILFPTRGLRDARMREANNLLAESFSRGVRQNIAHYSKVFLENERRSVLQLKELRSALQSALLDQARPTVTVTIQNSGDRPVTFRPYFGLAVLGTDQRAVSDNYVLVSESSSAPQAEAKELADILLERSDADRSKDVKVAPYLPSVGGLTYTTVAPGSSLSIRLTALDRLGAKGSQYRTAYDSGLLTTKVVAVTTHGKEVWSEVSVFGASLNKQQQEEVNKLLR